MRGDFSRIRFNPARNYTAVLEQQGRVALDADENEQRAIDGYLRNTKATDVIGDSGAPIGDDGFSISISNGKLMIGAGRYYVQGLLCENTKNIAYDNQPYLISDTTSSSLLQAVQQQRGAVVLQVWLEVWERLVTAREDSCLLEPALGQAAETSVRRQTVWRVFAELSEGDGSRPLPSSSASESSNASTPSNATPAVVHAGIFASFEQAHAAVVSDASNYVAPAPEADSADANKIVVTAPKNQDVTVQKLTSANATCCQGMRTPIHKLLPGRMAAQTNPAADSCGCEPIASAGYLGMENQLYRVEIHHSGSREMATFKWSRENGSVLAGIEAIDGADVRVDSLGPDANLGLLPNQWVEIFDDKTLFGDTPNNSGDLYQIQSIDPSLRRVTLFTPVTGIDVSRNARMRRWDQSGTTVTSDGIALGTDMWFPLENGIEVRFEKGDFEPGDAWTIPARAATGTIEWPPCGREGSFYQPAHRTEIYRVPLACIQWARSKESPDSLLIADCRKLFPPLIDLLAARSFPALHVRRMSWGNDDDLPLDMFLRDGLEVWLDGTITGPVSSAIFIVTVEDSITKFVQQDAAVIRQPYIVDGVVSANGYALSWSVAEATKSIPSWIQAQATEAQRMGSKLRVRVRILGNSVQGTKSDAPIYLDGETYTVPVTAAQRSTLLDLQLPSGSGRKASDFESWFYLSLPLTLDSIVVNYPALIVAVNANNKVTGVQAVVTPGVPAQNVNPFINITLSGPAPSGGATIDLALTGDSQIARLESYSVQLAAGESFAQVGIQVLSNPANQQTVNFTVTASLAPTDKIATSFSVKGSLPPIIIG